MNRKDPDSTAAHQQQPSIPSGRGFVMKHPVPKFFIILTILSMTMVQPAFAGSVSGDSLCTFTLEGKEYTIPFDQTVLEEAGWTASQDMDYNLGGMIMTSLYWYKDTPDSMYNLDTSILNGTGNAKKAKDCQICSLLVTRQDLDSFSFALSNGIKPGDDLETVKDIMGAPDSVDEYSDYTIASYGDKGKDGAITFLWHTDEKEKEKDYIHIECYETVETETKNDIPAYLNEYEAPDELSPDFDDTTISIEKVVYQLPCPVTAFEENGWTLTENNPVMSGRFGMSKLKKGKKILEIIAINFADYQTTFENCAITEIKVYSFQEVLRPVPAIMLSKNISFDSTIEDLDALDEFKKEEQNASVTYSCNIPEKEIIYRISYDKTLKCITSITVSKDILHDSSGY